MFWELYFENGKQNEIIHEHRKIWVEVTGRVSLIREYISSFHCRSNLYTRC